MSASPRPEEVWVKTEPDWDEDTSDKMLPKVPAPMGPVHIKVESEKAEPDCEDSSTSNVDVTETSAPPADLVVNDEVVAVQECPQIPRAPDDCVPTAVGRNCRKKKRGLETPHYTESDLKPYSCPICKRTYVRSCHLKRHVKTHNGTKPYTCKICNHKFTLLDNLRRHERTHTGERPYSCDVCKKYFTDAGYLKTHKRIHTGEKPFCCKICNKKFMQSCNLKKHELIHTGVKLFECSICGQKCTEKGTLKRHVRIHTGEKPFACRICPKKFITGSNLKRHERTHTLDHFIPEEYLNREIEGIR